VKNGRYRQKNQISDVVASRDLKRMCDLGLLIPIGEKRGRFYIADEPPKKLGNDALTEAAPPIPMTYSSRVAAAFSFRCRFDCPHFPLARRPRRLLVIDLAAGDIDHQLGGLVQVARALGKLTQQDNHASEAIPWRRHWRSSSWPPLLKQIR
jgi:hypothetical protein